jgi:hypothetical protein
VSTKRTPLNRPGRRQISDAAIAAFRRLRAAGQRCTCAPRDWGGEYWRHVPCNACDEWWAAHNELYRALGLPPWRWPAVADPEAANPYPDGSTAAKGWSQDAEAVDLWRELQAAAGA